MLHWLAGDVKEPALLSQIVTTRLRLCSSRQAGRSSRPGRMVMICDRLSARERLVINVSRSLHLWECLIPLLFRTRNIRTLHSPFYLCWPLGCLGVSSSPDNTTDCNITFLARILIILYMLPSCTAVTVRHEVVAVRASLATCLESSRSAILFRGIPFRDMTSGVTV